MTVREVARLPLMTHLSEPTLYRLIEEGALPARRFSERKLLLLVTDFCPAHQTKAPDDLDAFIDSSSPGRKNRR